MKTIKVRWITNSRGSIGVVLAENEFTQKAYISTVPGNDEQSDIELVKNWGAKLSLSEAKGFFGIFVNEEKFDC